MKIIRGIVILIVFIPLTILTQVGGIIYLASFPLFIMVDKRIGKKVAGLFVKGIIFLSIYSLATFYIVPLIARPFGRVPLPVITNGNLQPLNFITCLFNRHYVKPELKQIAVTAAGDMHKRYPGTVVNYLDAGFPFFNRFPLIPHLSHNDGKKLDIAFCYIDKRTGEMCNRTPSPIGYGVSEEPRPGEINMAERCAGEGYWQYSFMRKFIPQYNKTSFVFDSVRTKALVQILAASPGIGKIFIEPHLKQRMGLVYDKIRFHGCHAVRHDDHIHIQLE